MRSNKYFITKQKVCYINFILRINYIYVIYSQIYTEKEK